MEIKSKLIQCPKGHYYNGALHDSCPVCRDEGGSSFTPAPTAAPKADKITPPPAYIGVTVPVGDQAPHAAAAFPPTQPIDNSNMGSGSFGNTMAPDNIGSAGASVGEEAAASDGRFDPVVGWLVCIEGAAQGRDFQIHAGYNYIGRDDGDICVPGDMQISRQNHAMVAYDTSDDVYYVGPSAGRNLIKVNNRTIFNAVELKTYDVISIGSTKLMFVALCGEKFNWARGKAND